ncbi:MAG: DUF4115 domain-containing protein [Chloroflexi bacterium]|nr:DUF4115 domain-containing protein [Chloroflexota bacterium]
MPESIGQRLKHEREARFLTLERASEATRIRVVFLQALESDDYSVMPSAAQGRGFLRNYAEYLELDIDEMIAEIQRNAASAPEVSGPLQQVNLNETEIPSLTETQDEKPARSFLTSLLGRRPKTEPAPESESTELTQEALVKPEGETLPIEQDRAEIPKDARPGVVSRLLGRFGFGKKKDAESDIEEIATAIETESKPPIPSQPADVIFAEIGAKLRERRELISLTHEEVERHTKLRAAYVKALEEGALDKLPSPVQTRGMLANYAAFLDLDTEATLLRFADVLQARRHEKYAETPREKIQTEVVTSLPLLRSFIAGDLVFGVMMIAVLIALAIWGVGRMISSQAEAEATAPPVVNVLESTPLPTGTPISLESLLFTPTATIDPLATIAETPTPGVSANVTVNLFAVERAFVRVSVDGEVAFEGRFAPGEIKVFEANDQVSILTGNAAAFRITYNGRDLGLMGNVGEVVSRVYLISGIVAPTATISPTPTVTLPPTVTPVPSSTPSATPTATVNSN